MTEHIPIQPLFVFFVDVLRVETFSRVYSFRVIVGDTDSNIRYYSKTIRQQSTERFFLPAMPTYLYLPNSTPGPMK